MDFRALFYSLFAKTPSRRRRIVKYWHSTYPTLGPKTHPRLADVFQEFITDILFEPMTFKLKDNQFCLFARGKESLAIQMSWLELEEREFIYDLHSNRKTLFRNIKQTANNQFEMSGIVLPEDAMEHVWKREIVRDFIWMVHGMAIRTNSGGGWMIAEMIAAVQGVMLTCKADVFLVEIHAGLQGRCNIREVPCWGLQEWDLHPEEKRNKE